MLDELSLDEKKIVYPVIAIIVVILLIVLFFIWKPEDTNISSNINKVQTTLDYADTQVEKYTNILKSLLLTANFDNLYDKISEDWKNENNFQTKEEIKEYLFENFIITNSAVTIKDYEVFSSDDIYIFKFIIDSNGVERDVIINETSPYQYTISFEQEGINALSNIEYTYSTDNVNFNVKTQYAGDSVIQYEIIVTNNSEDSYTWMMNELNSVSLVLDDGTEIKATDMTSFGVNSVGVQSGSSFTFKVTFNVTLENQSFINNIKFSNIYKNGATSSIVVLLSNGGE